MLLNIVIIAKISRDNTSKMNVYDILHPALGAKMLIYHSFLNKMYVI